MKVFNDHGDTRDIKQMNMKEKVGLADAMSIVLHQTRHKQRISERRNLFR